jgi:hypothetical protein
MLAKTSEFLIDFCGEEDFIQKCFRVAIQHVDLSNGAIDPSRSPGQPRGRYGDARFLLYENLRLRFPDLKFKTEKQVSIGQVRAKQATVCSMRPGSRESEVVVFLIRRPSQGTPHM